MKHINKLNYFKDVFDDESLNRLNVIVDIIKDRGIDILSESGFLTWLEKNGIKHREEVAKFADLPANDSLNTVRGVADDNKIYIKKENGWIPFQTIDISKINKVENKVDSLGINVLDFGAVADANYKNPNDNKYYSDSDFKTLATDNKDAFSNILDFTNLNKDATYKIIFPAGNFYSSTPLRITARGVDITGNSARLIVSAPDSSTAELLNIYVTECEYFRCNGMTFENIIENKSVVSSNGGRYYHIWLRGDGTRKIKHCNIYDNTFIDNVSAPNTTAYTFNGSVWTSSAENVFIHDNNFENSCGRVTYIASSENLFIYNNSYKNVGFVPTEVKNITIGTLVFRTLSNKNVNIFDNTVDCAEVWNSQNTVPLFGVMLDRSSGELTPNENVKISNNKFNANGSPLKTFNLASVDGAEINNNEVNLGNENDTSFIYIGTQSSEELKAVNIKFISNTINNAHSNTIEVLTTTPDSNKIKILMKNNIYDSNKTFERISLNTSGISAERFDFVGDTVCKNSKKVGELLRWDILDYNVYATSILNVSTSNYTDYINSAGVLNIPTNVYLVRLNVSDLLNITDIQHDGKYLTDKRVTILNSTTTKHTLKYDVSLIRLHNATDFNLGAFGSITLIRGTNMWYELK